MAPERMRSVGQGMARWFSPAAVVAALVLVAVLAAKNQSLQREVRRLSVQDKLPHSGLVVPAFRTETLTGDSVTIGSAIPGGRQVLFFFTTTCPYCLQTLPVWKDLDVRLRYADSTNVQVFGISLDSVEVTARFVSTHHLAFPVVRFPDAKTAALYRAVGVPITVVLDHDGVVLYGRAGALTSSAADSVMAAVREAKSESLIPAA